MRRLPRGRFVPPVDLSITNVSIRVCALQAIKYNGVHIDHILAHWPKRAAPLPRTLTRVISDIATVADLHLFLPVLGRIVA